ncbi:MAG: hypothetical protein GY751_27035 [Bacteroidetes bacterium]|nr:hypothetical protein [Bacteroidota bacterium]
MTLTHNPIRTIERGSAATSDNFNASFTQITDNFVQHEADINNVNDRISENASSGNRALSESDVDSKIAEVINLAPDTLDTFNEISQALGDDPFLAATLEHIRPNRIIGPAIGAGVTHTEADFADNLVNGEKILFLSGNSISTDKEISANVRLMMATPDTYVNLNGRDITFSSAGEVDGELNVSGSGTLTIEGLSKGLKINTQGSISLLFSDSNGSGVVFLNGEMIVGSNITMTGKNSYFRPPALTTAERDNLSPAPTAGCGWVIYNETEGEVQVFTNDWSGLGGEADITITDTYSIPPTIGYVFCETKGSDYTVTLCPATGMAGKTIVIKNLGTDLITIEGYGTETIERSLKAKLTTAFQSYTLYCNGSEWYIV